MDGTAKTVFQLDSKPSFFESIVARPCGTLLVTRQDTNELWEIDPASGTGKCIINIPEVASLTGLTDVSTDIYAVGAGTYRLENHEGSVPGSYSVWVMDLFSGDEPHAHSYYGKIYRINLADGKSSILFEHDILTDPPGSLVTMGVNDIKVRSVEGTKSLYFTNTTRMLFYRLTVNKSITVTGEVEILNIGSIPQSEVVVFVPDDFCFAQNGAVYVTTHPANMVFRIPPGGGEAVRVVGDYSSWEAAAATACTFGSSANDQNFLYITTAGAYVIPIKGMIEPAKILALETKDWRSQRSHK
ncbi:hypothetical protein F4679DRAFT_572849 [Xylaria curta]|nr:hypothetical protein F4679DRAFT_572849 [Xylaria curta]